MSHLKPQSSFCIPIGRVLVLGACASRLTLKGSRMSIEQWISGKEQYTAEFKKLNPMHFVPVLVDGDIVVSDSFAILLSRNSTYISLGDGRSLCLECMESAIMDTGDCQPLYHAIRDYYEGMNMKLDQ